MKKLIAIVSILALSLPSAIFAGKQATLINPFGSKVVVESGSANAQSFFSKGFVLMSDKILGSAAATGTVGIKWVQAQNFTLAGSGAILGATTITLKSFKDTNGVLLTMTDFGSQGFATIEPGSGAKEEQITFTGVTQNANGTATLTGIKTVLMKYPYTETSGTITTHVGGTKFVLSNTAGFYNTFVNKENSDTLNGVYTYTWFPKIATSTALPTAKDRKSVV